MRKVPSPVLYLSKTMYLAAFTIYEHLSTKTLVCTTFLWCLWPLPNVFSILFKTDTLHSILYHSRSMEKHQPGSSLSKAFLQVPWCGMRQGQHERAWARRCSWKNYIIIYYIGRYVWASGKFTAALKWNDSCICFGAANLSWKRVCFKCLILTES